MWFGFKQQNFQYIFPTRKSKKCNANISYARHRIANIKLGAYRHFKAEEKKTMKIFFVLKPLLRIFVFQKQQKIVFSIWEFLAFEEVRSVLSLIFMQS